MFRAECGPGRRSAARRFFFFGPRQPGGVSRPASALGQSAITGASNFTCERFALTVTTTESRVTLSESVTMNP